MDLWAFASIDIEAEKRDRALIEAKVDLADVWPFVAAAENALDFDNRVAIVAARIDAACKGDVQVRRQVVASLRTDFGALRRAAAITDADCPGSGEGVEGDFYPGEIVGNAVGKAECPVCHQMIPVSGGSDGIGTLYVHLKPGKTLSDRSASRKTAISLTNVGFEGGIGSNVGVGTDPDGNRVRFRLSDKDASDLASVLTGDLAGNFSGVDVDPEDIITTASRKTALSYNNQTMGRGCYPSTAKGYCDGTSPSGACECPCHTTEPPAILAETFGADGVETEEGMHAWHQMIFGGGAPTGFQVQRMLGAKKMKVIQDPLNGNKWQVRVWSEENQVWGDMGDPCDSEAEANAKMDAEQKKASLRVTATRPLYEIAQEIRQNWKPVYFGAVPYLDAMSQLDSINDRYGADDAKYIVMYFLSNARQWRGEVAQRIKAELKGMTKGASLKTAEVEGIEESLAIAKAWFNDNWQGIYTVRLHDHNAIGDIFEATLHGPDGDSVFCRVNRDGTVSDETWRNSGEEKYRTSSRKMAGLETTIGRDGDVCRVCGKSVANEECYFDSDSVVIGEYPTSYVCRNDGNDILKAESDAISAMSYDPYSDPNSPAFKATRKQGDFLSDHVQVINVDVPAPPRGGWKFCDASAPEGQICSRIQGHKGEHRFSDIVTEKRAIRWPWEAAPFVRRTAVGLGPLRNPNSSPDVFYCDECGVGSKDAAEIYEPSWVHDESCSLYRPSGRRSWEARRRTALMHGYHNDGTFWVAGTSPSGERFSIDSDDPAEIGAALMSRGIPASDVHETVNALINEAQGDHGGVGYIYEVAASKEAGQGPNGFWCRYCGDYQSCRNPRETKAMRAHMKAHEDAGDSELPIVNGFPRKSKRKTADGVSGTVPPEVSEIRDTNLRDAIAQSDWYDAWGAANGWAFGIADWLADECGMGNGSYGRQDVTDALSRWQYHNPSGHGDEEAYEYQELVGIEPDYEDAVQAGDVLDTIIKRLKAEGKDY